MLPLLLGFFLPWPSADVILGRYTRLEKLLALFRGPKTLLAEFLRIFPGAGIDDEGFVGDFKSEDLAMSVLPSAPSGGVTTIVGESTDRCVLECRFIRADEIFRLHCFASGLFPVSTDAE